MDHFIPWARYANDAIENLVVAHERCNNHKRDFLAASEHLAHGRQRLDPDGRTSPELLEVAAGARWETAPDRSPSVTRAIYLRLSSGARLWLGGSEFEVAEPAELEAVLA